MTRLIWKRVATLVIVVIGAGMAGTWTAEQLREREATRRDQREVARMTAKISSSIRFHRAPPAPGAGHASRAGSGA